MFGKGAYGKVFQVRLLESDEHFAMKVLKKVEINRKDQVSILNPKGTSWLNIPIRSS